MELTDCAFPTFAGAVATDDPAVAFKGADTAFLFRRLPTPTGRYPVHERSYFRGLAGRSNSELPLKSQFGIP
jgi:hypothetical protein